MTPPSNEVWLFPTRPGEQEDRMGRKGWTALWVSYGKPRAQCSFTQLAKLQSQTGWSGKKVIVLDKDPT